MPARLHKFRYREIKNGRLEESRGSTAFVPVGRVRQPKTCGFSTIMDGLRSERDRRLSRIFFRFRHVKGCQAILLPIIFLAASDRFLPALKFPW
ncbi:hypothetical protein CO648_27260 [Rhizobium phaseoli]|nr:hypothetical protein CO648_27260 [Rhizobium phaseoli]